MGIHSFGEAKSVHHGQHIGVPHLEGVVRAGSSEESGVMRVPLDNRHSVGRGVGVGRGGGGSVATYRGVVWWGGGTTVTVWEGGRGVDPGQRGWGVCSNIQGGCVVGWRDHCHSVGRGKGR